MGPTSLCLLPVIVTTIEYAPGGRPGLSPVPSEQSVHTAIFNPGLPASKPEVLQLGILSGRCAASEGATPLSWGGLHTEGVLRRAIFGYPQGFPVQKAGWKNQTGFSPPSCSSVLTVLGTRRVTCGQGGFHQRELFIKRNPRGWRLAAGACSVDKALAMQTR